MEATPLNDAPASNRLSWTEIRDRYPGEWVMLVDIDWINEDDHEFRSALVLGHGKSRKQVYREANHLKGRHKDLACRYTSEAATGPLCFFSLLPR